MKKLILGLGLAAALVASPAAFAGDEKKDAKSVSCCEKDCKKDDPKCVASSKDKKCQESCDKPCCKDAKSEKKEVKKPA